MADNAPTYDELLAKFNALSEENKEMSEKMQAYEGKISEMDDALKQSRALNTKLMFNDPSVGVPNEPDVPEPEPETLEQFIDSFAKVAVEHVNIKYGEKIYGDNY